MVAAAQSLTKILQTNVNELRVNFDYANPGKIFLFSDKLTTLNNVEFAAWCLPTISGKWFAANLEANNEANEVSRYKLGYAQKTRAVLCNNQIRPIKVTPIYGRLRQGVTNGNRIGGWFYSGFSSFNDVDSAHTAITTGITPIYPGLTSLGNTMQYFGVRRNVTPFMNSRIRYCKLKMGKSRIIYPGKEQVFHLNESYRLRCFSHWDVNELNFQQGMQFMFFQIESPLSSEMTEDVANQVQSSPIGLLSDIESTYFCRPLLVRPSDATQIAGYDQCSTISNYRAVGRDAVVLEEKANY